MGSPPRNGKNTAKATTVPARFVPRFWDDIDGRLATGREIRRRVDELTEDTGADSAQKRILVARAVFLALKLETMEVEAAEGGKFEFGVYTAAVNSLSGLLSKLGLDKATPKTATLRAYVSGRDRT